MTSSMTAYDSFEDVFKREDRIRAEVLSVAKRRLLEHKSLLATGDCLESLQAMAGIEVCKIVIEALGRLKTLH